MNYKLNIKRNNKMKFMIQHNLINQKHLLKIKEAIKDYPHEFIGIIPFSREITSEIPIEGTNYFPYGSTSLIETTANLGWKGNYFDLTKLNYKNFQQNRNDMLNTNPVMKLTEAITFLKTRPEYEQWFTRPSNDLKEYSGLVDNVISLVEWMEDRLLCASSGSYQLSPDTEIVLDIPKEILAEYRWFIVDGKIISGSMYRNNGILKSIEQTNTDIIQKAQEIADKWLPMSNVVMDLALTNDGMKVIEFNCINASGFYNCNIDKIFKSIWKYYSGKE